MGDWTGTVPTIVSGSVPTGDDWDNILDELTAASVAWTAWTPTLTNMSQGNGTVTARYRRVGKTVDFLFSFLLGGTSTVGTSPSFTLPAAPASHYVTYHIAGIGEAQFYQAAGLFAGSSGTAVTIVHYTSSTATTITATVPVTWANSFHLAISGTYETT